MSKKGLLIQSVFYVPCFETCIKLASAILAAY